MDKNSITGLFLIGLIVFGFSYFSRSPEQLVQNTQKAKTEVVAEATPQQDAQLAVAETLPDSLQAALPLYMQKREQRELQLKNKNVAITLSTLGAKPVEVQLSDKYLNQEKQAVKLFQALDTKFNLPLITLKNTSIATEQMTFSLLSATDSTASFRLPLEEDAYLDFNYSLLADDYLLRLNIKGHNLNKVLPVRTTRQELEWAIKIPQQEESHRFEAQYSGIYYYSKAGDVDDLAATSEGKERVGNALKWVAFKDKYFSSVLINEGETFEDTHLSVRPMEEGTNYVGDCSMNTTIPFDVRNGAEANLTFFFGPNDYELLSDYDDTVFEGNELELNNLVYLGASIFRWVNQWIVIPIITLLQRFISNWGLIIFLLTLIIKLALYPITFKSYVSQAKMRVLKPQVEAINAKFEGKTDKDAMLQKQKETMALYSSAGASPMGGCLPMLLQMPFLIALYMYFPTSILLRGESFLWANDLSTYDAIISWDFDIPIISSMIGNHLSLFCLLMTAVNIFYTKYTMSQSPSTGNNEAMSVMKYMPYMMAVMFFFMFNSNASGLSYYYFISISITMIQYFASRYLIDEDKLLQQMEENKKKPRKKSKWLEKLEEAQRQQRAMQAKQNKR